MKTEIIYEDQDIIVVRKPAGLATQTAKVGQQDVASELKNYLRKPYLGVIHRLDQPVEGLLVFAKNRGAAAGLTAQLQRQGEGGILHKRYYAVLCGRPPENEGRFVDYLYKDESGKAVVVQDISASGMRGTAKGIGASGKSDARENIGEPGMVNVRKDTAPSGVKRAALSYRILQVIDSPAELALVEICLETGRFHQIRAQMAYHGYPLLGDVKYGNDRGVSLSQRLGIQKMSLCAFCLEFVHPMSKKNLCFRIEPCGKAFSYFGDFS